LYKFNFSTICIKGSKKEICEDNILVSEKLSGCEIHSPQVNSVLQIFLADGIGGIKGGEVASDYILESIAKIQLLDHITDHIELEKQLREINLSLIEHTKNQPDITGAGTTLVGVLADQENFVLISAGDSEAWLLRNTDFSRLTFPQNLNPFEENSPLVSYFGGTTDSLDLQIDTSLPHLEEGDILLLCSDGLFKVFDEKRIKLILSTKQSIAEKGKFIYQKAQELFRPDDLSCILVEVTKECKK